MNYHMVIWEISMRHKTNTMQKLEFKVKSKSRDTELSETMMYSLGLSIKMQPLIHICLIYEITNLLKCYQNSYNKLVVTTRWLLSCSTIISAWPRKKKSSFVVHDVEPVRFAEKP
jgi:hypothetical protein